MLLFESVNDVCDDASVLIVTPAPRFEPPYVEPRSPVSVLFENVTLLVPELVAFVENWKWSPRLLLNVEPVTLTVMPAVSFASRCRPSLPVFAVEVLLSVLPVTVRFSEPLESVTIIPFSGEPELVELDTE